jgi:hypothetical protein
VTIIASTVLVPVLYAVCNTVYTEKARIDIVIFFSIRTKDGGQDPLYYMYVTVFIRNAAYLTQLLTKASKIRNRNKNFYFRFYCPFTLPFSAGELRPLFQLIKNNS